MRSFRFLSARLLPTLCSLFVVLPLSAQDSAATLFRQVAAKARNTRGFSAHIELTRQAANQPALTTSGTFQLRKPNFALIQLAGDDPPRILASDGRDLFTFPDPTHYTQTSVDARGLAINTPWWSLPLRFFFSQSLNPFGAESDPTAKLTLLPDERVGTQAYRVLAVHGSSPMAYAARFYINRDDIIERSVVTFGDEAKPNVTFSARLSEIHTNQALTAASFRFSPPANATAVEGSPADRMLSLGDTTPAFTLKSIDGSAITLPLARQGARATLINFWYLDCPPCLIEFPEFEKLYQQLHAKGLNILAIDKGDSPQNIERYARKTGLTFPLAVGGEETAGSIFDHYRVDSFPGTYLLDANGRIVYRAAGGDLKGLREALNKLGLN